MTSLIHSYNIVVLRVWMDCKVQKVAEFVPVCYVAVGPAWRRPCRQRLNFHKPCPPCTLWRSTNLVLIDLVLRTINNTSDKPCTTCTRSHTSQWYPHVSTITRGFYQCCKGSEVDVTRAWCFCTVSSTTSCRTWRWGIQGLHVGRHCRPSQKPPCLG